MLFFFVLLSFRHDFHIVLFGTAVNGFFDHCTCNNFFGAVEVTYNQSLNERIDVVDIESAIDEVKGDDGVKVIYDLQGRKLETPTQGIYIVNGEKVFVK